MSNRVKTGHNSNLSLLLLLSRSQTPQTKSDLYLFPTSTNSSTGLFVSNNLRLLVEHFHLKESEMRPSGGTPRSLPSQSRLGRAHTPGRCDPDQTCHDYPGPYCLGPPRSYFQRLLVFVRCLKRSDGWEGKANKVLLGKG